MSIPKYKAESGILYVRASLRPFTNAIRCAGYEVNRFTKSVMKLKKY